MWRLTVQRRCHFRFEPEQADPQPCCEEEATCAPPELSPRGDRRRTGMERRVILNGKEQRYRRKCGDMRAPDNPAVGVSDWPDIGCGLTGPGAERGVGVRPGMLMVIA